MGFGTHQPYRVAYGRDLDAPFTANDEHVTRCYPFPQTNKSAASAASPDYVNFQAVIKSAASAASLRGGRASGRLDHGLFSQFLAALAAKK